MMCAHFIECPRKNLNCIFCEKLLTGIRLGKVIIIFLFFEMKNVAQKVVGCMHKMGCTLK